MVGAEVDHETLADFGEVSAAPSMLESLEKALTPVQRYMLRFLEETSDRSVESACRWVRKSRRDGFF